MELEIEITGNDSTGNASDLKTWLSRESGLSLTKFEQVRSIPKTGELGPDLMPILSVVLASPLITELVKSIFNWFGAKRSSNVITIKIDGVELNFSAKDSDKISAIIEKLQNVK